MVDLKNKYFDR